MTWLLAQGQSQGGPQQSGRRTDWDQPRGLVPSVDCRPSPGRRPRVLDHLKESRANHDKKQDSQDHRPEGDFVIFLSLIRWLPLANVRAVLLVPLGEIAGLSWHCDERA